MGNITNVKADLIIAQFALAKQVLLPIVASQIAATINETTLDLAINDANPAQPHVTQSAQSIASAADNTSVMPTANAYALPKSAAQVATLVSPPVSPKSCELKLRESKRRNPLTLRLSELERGIIVQKARQAGCSVNGYLKGTALASNYKPPADPALTRTLLALTRELTAQGNNLNQLARQRNANVITEAQSGRSISKHVGYRQQDALQEAAPPYQHQPVQRRAPDG